MDTELDVDAFSKLANEIMETAGLGPRSGHFTADVAWAAHERANERSAAGTILKALLDLEDHFGPGSPQEAVVQTIVNCGPIVLEPYPIAIDTWTRLGFELYKNGDGSHGAHIPMWLRKAAGTSH